MPNRDGPRSNTTVRLPTDLRIRIDKARAGTDLTFTQAITRIVRYGLPSFEDWTDGERKSFGTSSRRDRSGR